MKIYNKKKNGAKKNKKDGKSTNQPTSKDNKRNKADQAVVGNIFVWGQETIFKNKSKYYRRHNKYNRELLDGAKLFLKENSDTS